MPRVTGGSVAAHRQATRDAIFAAFSSLVYERGYDAVSLADVAAAAGMSRTTMYNYFADKDALVVAFTEAEVTSFTEGLAADLAGAGTPADRLRVYIAAQLRYISRNHLPPGRSLQVLLSPETYQRLLHHVHSMEDTLRGILADGVGDGSFDADVGTALPLVSACINRAGSLGHDDIERETDATTTFVLRALGAVR
ncbi:TetR/AcrR family transcriptional regulator [Desertimonas flava]|uniref:TetR/AcrR family transcriptional regulator n=1 Tax=Desertimonas flava TaxID=2064846 RepID=UPI0013C3F5E5|nr:TetR/AcrR family transcriptional regulator [Desertimonas flava]